MWMSVSSECGYCRGYYPLGKVIVVIVMSVMGVVVLLSVVRTVRTIIACWSECKCICRVYLAWRYLLTAFRLFRVCNWGSVGGLKDVFCPSCVALCNGADELYSKWKVCSIVETLHFTQDTRGYGLVNKAHKANQASSCWRCNGIFACVLMAYLHT